MAVEGDRIISTRCMWTMNLTWILLSSLWRLTRRMIGDLASEGRCGAGAIAGVLPPWPCHAVMPVVATATAPVVHDVCTMRRARV